MTEYQETTDSLFASLDRIDKRLARLVAAEYERRVSHLCMGVISNAIGGLRRFKLMHSVAFGTIPEFYELMEASADADLITFDQWYDVLNTDSIVSARKSGETIYAVVEISLTVHQDDIDRAAERAAIIHQATGAPAYPVVIGDSVPPPQQTQAIAKNVLALTIQQPSHY